MEDGILECVRITALRSIAHRAAAFQAATLHATNLLQVIGDLLRPHVTVSLYTESRHLRRKKGKIDPLDVEFLLPAGFDLEVSSLPMRPRAPRETEMHVA